MGRPREGSKRKITIYLRESDAQVFDRVAEEKGLSTAGPVYVEQLTRAARRLRRELPEKEEV